MTLAILGIIAALIPLVVWVVQRGIKKHDDPLEQHRIRMQRIQNDMASGDSAGSNANASDDLAELERLRLEKSRRDSGRSM